MRVRTLLIAGAALLASVAALAGAIVQAGSTSPSGVAQRFWPGHPAALTSSALTQIGRAAATGGEVPMSARQAMRSVARKAPLEAEPFLVEGTVAQTSGDLARAQRLFEAARAHDPRSSAARYFLAQRFLTTGRVRDGLREVLALSRVAPGAGPQLLPALVSFATMPGAQPLVEDFLKSAPEFRQRLLSELAGDPRNASLVFALGARAEPGSWQSRLVGALVKEGNYAGAFAAWRRLTEVRESGTLFNPGFRSLDAPRPFNWTLASGTAALVEPAEGEGLQIVYYGRDDAILASQTLLLQPGRYRLSVPVAGGSDGAGLDWSVTCLTDKRLLLRLPLGGTGRREAGASFVVPEGCTAQQIALRGTAGEGRGAVDINVGRLSLAREATP